MNKHLKALLILIAWVVGIGAVLAGIAYMQSITNGWFVFGLIGAFLLLVIYGVILDDIE